MEPMKSGLTISEREAPPVQVLTLTGYLDGHTFVELERRLEGLVAAGRTRLVIELSGLDYIASAGVGSFINCQHQVKRAGGNLQLVNPSASVREVFAILGLESLFVIHQTVEAGIAAASKA
jgi:anti-sigma B factor antagonist